MVAANKKKEKKEKCRIAGRCIVERVSFFYHFEINKEEKREKNSRERWFYF